MEKTNLSTLLGLTGALSYHEFGEERFKLFWKHYVVYKQGRGGKGEAEKVLGLVSSHKEEVFYASGLVVGNSLEWSLCKQDG